MAQYNSLTNQAKDNGGPNLEGMPVHEEYQANINRWAFLQHSYNGSSQYRRGRYLTQYINENASEYISRIAQTPLDNHVKSCIHIWNSFLFRNQPKRRMGNLEGLPELEAFFKDADLEGRDFNQFMRDVNIQASVYGSSLILVDKPKTSSGTRADELQQNIRPYLSLYTAENIIDWEFTRLSNGLYELSFLRLLEREQRSFNRKTFTNA